MEFNRDEVRKALEAADIEPWAKIKFFNGTIEVWQSIDNTGICRLIGTDENADANGYLISMAPTWIYQLLEREQILIDALNYSTVYLEEITSKFNLTESLSRDAKKRITLNRETLRKVGEIE